MLIELQFEYLQFVLNILLQDKNTNKNIIWATDDYKKYGNEYLSNSEMTSYDINALDIKVLQPRVSKSKEIQKGRTKDKAEVFTPSWICDRMNSYCDNDWFNIKKKGKDGKIKFIFDDKKTFKEYIDLRKLEMTCGEAPYVVSRYDATTGDIIPLYKRIGFLDRKLLAISQYVNDKEDWFNMVCRAYESSYGYEYQGDNLLKARINLFYTFIDYYEKKWIMFPSNLELKKIATIISRNFWQMDGLTYTVPMTDIECKVYNWRSKKNMNVIGVDNMKFDYVVGNPPYQGENHRQIYPDFYEQSKEVVKDNGVVCLIFPSGWQAPKNANNLSKMNKEEVKADKQIVFIDNRDDAFPGVSGAKNTNVLMWKKGFDNKLNGKQLMYQNGQNPEQKQLVWDKKDIEKPSEIVKLSEIVMAFPDFKALQQETSVLKPYGFRTDVLDSPAKYGFPEMSDVKKNDSDITIYGLKARKSVKCYLEENYPIPRFTDCYDKYKVFIGKAWGNYSDNYLGGAYADIVIASPKEICTENFLESGCFNNFENAKKHAKYLMTQFCRALLVMNKHTQDNSRDKWVSVPIQTYEEEWWDKSISEINIELFKKYNIPQNIVDFVNSNVQVRTEENIINFNKEME